MNEPNFVTHFLCLPQYSILNWSLKLVFISRMLIKVPFGFFKFWTIVNVQWKCLNMYTTYLSTYMISFFKNKLKKLLWQLYENIINCLLRFIILIYFEKFSINSSKRNNSAHNSITKALGPCQYPSNVTM